MRERKDRDRTFSRRSLTGQVAHSLGMQIVCGEIAEGEVLATEEAASRAHSVSRTAYREAIKVLTAKGLVDSRPKIGTRVRPRDDWNMLDPDVMQWASKLATTTDFADSLFEFRLIIEPEAARLAAEKQLEEKINMIATGLEIMETTEPSTQENLDADLAFHAAILNASGNEFLRSLNHMVDALLIWSFEISSRKEGIRAASVPLHRSVYNCILKRDGNGAKQAMAHLLQSAREDIDQIVLPDNEGDQASANRVGPTQR